MTTPRGHLRLVVDEPPEPYEVTATPDWPPVAIPGQPGCLRHYVDGQQVDRPIADQRN